MAKDFYEGYKLGALDGKSGDNKLASRSFKRLVSKIGSWLPGAENRDAQFREGYLTGFNDKVRTIQTSNIAPNNTTLPATGGTMSSSTSFSHQVELLLGLKQYLNDFQDRLSGVSANYERKLNELHGAGLMEETYQRYSANELTQTKAMIARLIEHIEQSDLPAVNKEIAYLEQKI